MSCHRSLDKSSLKLRRQQQKTLHATLNTAALLTAILAVTAAWKSHTLKRPDPIPNLYSPHRCTYVALIWVGVACCAIPSVELF